MNEIAILIAEDDADDRYLLQAAFDENGYEDKLCFVENGLELIDYLHQWRAGKPGYERPSFIMLDLNMPRKDGREVLTELKNDDLLRTIPVIVFSTTNNEQEMKRCYDAGANSYITKPNSFEGLVQTVAAVRSYWVHFTNI